MEVILPSGRRGTKGQCCGAGKVFSEKGRYDSHADAISGSYSVNRPGASRKKGNGSGIDKKTSIRRKRLKLLKEKVEKGTYRVKPMKVAEKMIENAVRRIRSRDGSG